MKNNENINNIILLRDFLRNTWKSHATSMIIIDKLMHNQLNLNDSCYMFLSKESVALSLLTSSRAFIRIAEKISKVINIDYLKKSNINLNKEFPDHKNTRDILEHFEDYAFGKGNLQKNKKELIGKPLNVYLDERSVVIIQVYNLMPLDVSYLAYWIDWHMSQLEKELHELITPEIKWNGFNPHIIN